MYSRYIRFHWFCVGRLPARLTEAISAQPPRSATTSQLVNLQLVKDNYNCRIFDFLENCDI